MRVFLSGDTKTNWQDTIISKHPNHKFYDPRTLSGKTYKEMADTEKQWIDQSDIIFAYLNSTNPHGLGTSFEIGYSVANKKTIIYVDEKQISSSKWISEHLEFSFEEFSKGLEKLDEFLNHGQQYIANKIVSSMENQDFTVLIHNELDDELVNLISQQIYNNKEIYINLILASKMLPKRWYDWNLGYLIQKLNPNILIDVIKRYPENLYHSEGVAWALGIIGNDDQAIIDFLQKQCKLCEDFDAWWCAAHSLSQLNQGDAIEILKRTLIQEEWQNLDHCIKNIGSRPATIGILRKVNFQNINKIIDICLKNLSELHGRRLHNVIWLLERLRIRDKIVVDSLTKLHNSHISHGSSVSHRVVEALGKIAHPNSRDLLEIDLLGAKYFRTRALAAEGLGLIGDVKSIDVLVNALTSENNPHVISKISNAIYDIKDSERAMRNAFIVKSKWLENGMIIDESNKWYWSPDIYEKFSKAEDPESISFKLALSHCPETIATILDLGSGTGRFIDEIKEFNFKIEKLYALDNSPDMLKYLKKKYSIGISKVETLQSTIDSIPLEKETIDLVVSSWGFPSKVWDEKQSLKELKEVYRVLKPNGIFITIGWDEDFSDELSEVWHKFVIEEDYYFDSLAEYRRKKRHKIKSPRNCNLSFFKKKLQVPVKFDSVNEAADVFGNLFGYSAGVWVLESSKREFQMNVSITYNTRESIKTIINA
ncbi:MAG: methyltransferase domain-containing protein [Planctomycetia bacterium]|nr:methyltransferase domain-containing protein [Planctomycetia bacterium]